MKTKPDKAETINQLECKVCGHKWYPKTPRLPVCCSRCKSYKWNDLHKPEKEKNGS